MEDVGPELFPDFQTVMYKGKGRETVWLPGEHRSWGFLFFIFLRQERLSDDKDVQKWACAKREVQGKRAVMHRGMAPEQGRQKPTCADGEGAGCSPRHRPAFKAGAWQASGNVDFGGVSISH